MKKYCIIFILFLFCIFVTGCFENMRWEYDEYYAYKLLDDGTYCIKAKNPNNVPETVNLPRIFNGKYVTRIIENGFADCVNITEIVIPDTYKVIEKQAFVRCNNLFSVDISKNINYIGGAIFGKCQSLEVVFYDGTTDEWNKLSKSANWNNLVSEIEIVCIDDVIIVKPLKF